MKFSYSLIAFLFVVSFNPLHAQADSVFITPVQTVVGNQVRVDFPVQRFDQIVCLQYTMNYDANILQFDNIGNLNLPDLNENSFGQPEPGKITFSWLDFSTLGVTLNDDESIYSVFFSMAGGSGVSDLYIDGSFTMVEACISVETIPLIFNTITIAAFATSNDEVDATANVNVFPNPATDQVNFEISNLKGAVKVEVFDATGKFISQHDIKNGSLSLSKSSQMKAGIYHYRIYSDNTFISAGKYTLL